MPTGLELLAAQFDRKPQRAPVDEPVSAPDETGIPGIAEPSVIAPRNQGAFLSALNWLARPGQVVKNVVTGNIEGAGRQLADFVAEPVDAVIPFIDAIPQFSRPQDEVEGASLLGIDREKSPILGAVASLGVDVLTDPLTYVGFGPLVRGATAAARGAGSVISKLPKGAEALAAGSKALDTAGQFARRTTGLERLSPLAQKATDAAKASRAKIGATGMKEVERIATGLSKLEREVAGDILDNLRFDAGRPVGRLADTEDLAARLAAHPDAGKVDVAKVLQAAEDARGLGRTQFDEGVREGFFQQAPDAVGGIENYVPRKYTGQTGNQSLDEALGLGRGEMGSPSALKKRALQTPEEIVEFLKSEPGVTYTRDIVERLGDRATQQGAMAARAQIGKAVLGDAFNLADESQRSLAMEAIRTMAKTDPESARVLLTGLKGMPPRGKFMDTLASVNHVVKPMMVYGYGIPKVGSIVRNAVGGTWQALSNPMARGTALKQLGRLPSTLSGAVADSLGLKIGRDKFSAIIASLDNAMSSARGSADEAARILASGPGAGGIPGTELANLFNAGVMDGFVSSEQLVSTLSRTPWKAKYKNIVEWPGRMFRGVEDRMRVGMALDLVGKGKSWDEASRIVRDTLYDYSVSSAENRTARDLIPFFQFSAKAIPQQAKFLYEKPAVAVGLASLLTERQGEPKPPWLEGKLTVPIGQNEAGETQYLAGLGLPVEALALIPNPSGSVQQFGRDIGRSIVGQSQPVLKTAASAAFGVDPYFGSSFGSYSKLPGNIDAGAAGRAINILRGMGITQPLESLATTVGKLTDDRTSAGVKGLDLLTGANVVSVDPDRALQQRLTEYLKLNPNVASIQSLYANTNDPEALSLIRELNSVKARIRAKRKERQAQGQQHPRS